MTTWNNFDKTGVVGGGWQYNEANLTYNQVIDPNTGNIVYYNGIGLPTTWSNQSPKNTTNYSTPSKTPSSWTKINKS